MEWVWNRTSETFVPLSGASIGALFLDQLALNREKKYDASGGPGAASGWYCTLKMGNSLCRMPSTVPSFRLTCVISIVLGQGLQIDGKTMVLRGDCHFARSGDLSPADCRRDARTST